MTNKQRIEELEIELQSLKVRIASIEKIADLYPIKSIGPTDANPFVGTPDQQNNPFLRVN